MARAPVHRLKKSEIIWLQRHKCSHGHTYLEHYSCLLKERPDFLKLKVGYFDIETSNLSGDFGIMLCYCIKEADSKTIHYGVVTPKDLHTCLDKRVVEKCVKDLRRFDKVVSFYGKRFDLPFTRTRAIYWDIPFPEYGEVIHEDIYYIVRNKFRLSKNRLENSCRVLLGETQKTHIEPTHWIRALQGNKKSLKYILEHCKYDVTDLEKLHKRLTMFSKGSNVSI